MLILNLCLLICLLISFLLSNNFIRITSLFFTLFLFFNYLYLLVYYNNFKFNPSLLSVMYSTNFFNLNAFFAFDSISIFFLVLSLFLCIYCFIVYWFLYYRLFEYCLILVFLLLFLLCVFSTTDLYLFYIFFEALILPLFLIILIWGTRDRKIYAAYMFLFYTLIGSIFVMIFLLDYYINFGSSNLIFFFFSSFTSTKALLWFLLIFFGFSVKVPIVPLHIWLPEAHVEAPTGGSVILAGIILKLSYYAYIRLLSSFGFISIYSSFLIFMLTLFFFGLLYPSIVALTQIDLKKIIAYSSVAHMNFALIGFFGRFFIGLIGAFILMIGHAIVSSALFICIGSLYDRYKTRLIFYYGGLSSLMPIFSVIFIIFILANFGFPGTVNFVGEFLILVNGFYINTIIIIIASIALILTLIYSLFFYTRVVFGSIKVFFFRYYTDLTRREFYILSLFVVLTVLLGIFPNYILTASQLDNLKLVALLYH